MLRRYSDFDILRKILIERWPSCYIPSIPAKKAVGNLDTEFIEERREMLERFVLKIS
jgi:hypothetical protein